MTMALTPHQARPDLFQISDPPADMQANVGRDCYLKLVSGMANPCKAQVAGSPVAPLWSGDSPTSEPRLFRVECLQLNYKGAVCYRIYAHGGDAFGRCAGKDEVIFTEPLTKETH